MWAQTAMTEQLPHGNTPPWLLPMGSEYLSTKAEHHDSHNLWQFLATSYANG